MVCNVAPQTVSNTKTLVKLFIEAREELDTKTDALERAFKALDRNNSIEALIPYSVYSLSDMLLVELIGEEKVEHIHWWMYDSRDSSGFRCAEVEDDTGRIELETFEHFYAFFFEGKKCKDINDLL